MLLPCGGDPGACLPAPQGTHTSSALRGARFYFFDSVHSAEPFLPVGWGESAAKPCASERDSRTQRLGIMLLAHTLECIRLWAHAQHPAWAMHAHVAYVQAVHADA